MEFEIIIPTEYEELLEKRAEEQGVTLEKLLGNAIRNYIEKESTDGRK